MSPRSAVLLLLGMSITEVYSLQSTTSQSLVKPYCFLCFRETFSDYICNIAFNSDICSQFRVCLSEVLCYLQAALFLQMTKAASECDRV